MSCCAGLPPGVRIAVLRRAGLPSSVRPRSGQPCALCILGDLRVHATARCIHIQLRVAVLRNSPSICFGVRGCGPDRGRAWHLWSSSAARPTPFLRARRLEPARAPRPPAAFARGPSRDASSAEYRLLASRAFRGKCAAPALAHSLNEPPPPRSRLTQHWLYSHCPAVIIAPLLETARSVAGMAIIANRWLVDRGGYAAHLAEERGEACRARGACGPA